MAKRTRRSPEQMIKDLQAEIERVKARAARARVKKDPALKHISAAVRAIDKAAAATADKAIRSALAEGRATIAACLGLGGAAPAGAPVAARKQGAKVEPEKVVAYLTKNPGSSANEIASALGTDAVGLRPTVKELIADKRVKAKGKARGTRYAAG
jgi:hypothetical protein